VIPRYTRAEMGDVWAPRRRMEAWLAVELAATDAWADEGVVSREAADACRERASFSVDEVEERERTTGHDVAAFVDVVGKSIGEEGRWIHYGLTSSDVLDTGLAVQLGEAGVILLAGAVEYRDALVKRALEHRDTLSAGRTYGVHAEPTTFGLRLASFAFEADRNLERLRAALDGVAVGKLSGAVGTYASVPPSIERRVMDALGLRAEAISTQVVPRDRHAALVGAIALAGAGLERFATEIRNLQRTEVREVEEPFASGQKGSSAMPHKRNPILSERLCGLARVLRGYAQTAVENVALWHERDISHSGAERVILPDATILLDYMQHVGVRLAEGMTVHPDRMRDNLDLTHGALHSQRALTALVEGGMSRDEAYRLVQESAQRAWDEGTAFGELIAEAAPDLDLDSVLDHDAYLRHLPDVFARLEALRD
jgi:adenylosuccinate lyase